MHKFISILLLLSVESLAHAQVWERSCHLHLIVENLKQLKIQNRTSKSDSKKDADHALDQTLSHVQKTFKSVMNDLKKEGKKEDFAQCDEKTLQHPIKIDQETGQLIIPNTEKDVW